MRFPHVKKMRFFAKILYYDIAEVSNGISAVFLP